MIHRFSTPFFRDAQKEGGEMNLVVGGREARTQSMKPSQCLKGCITDLGFRGKGSYGK